MYVCIPKDTSILVNKKYYENNDRFFLLLNNMTLPIVTAQ